MQISSSRFHRQVSLTISLAMMRIRISLKSWNVNWNASTRFFGVELERTEQPNGERHLLTSCIVSLRPCASSYDPGPKKKVVGLLMTYPLEQVASKSDENCGTCRHLKFHRVGIESYANLIEMFRPLVLNGVFYGIFFFPIRLCCYRSSWEPAKKVPRPLRDPARMTWSCLSAENSLDQKQKNSNATASHKHETFP